MSFFVGLLVLSKLNYLEVWIFFKAGSGISPKNSAPPNQPIKIKPKVVEGSKKLSITNLKWLQKTQTHSGSSRNFPLGNISNSVCSSHRFLSFFERPMKTWYKNYSCFPLVSHIGFECWHYVVVLSVLGVRRGCVCPQSGYV